MYDELQVGEITFFDLKAKSVTHIIYVSGCIDALQLAGLTDSTTFLLVCEFLEKRLLLTDSLPLLHAFSPCLNVSNYMPMFIISQFHV